MRLIGLIVFMGLAWCGPSSFGGMTVNVPHGTLTPGNVIQTRLGTFKNSVYNSPSPAMPAGVPAGFKGRGVFILDLNVARGFVNVARVFKSTGNKQIDAALVASLQQWRVTPRMIHKLYVPVTVTGGKFVFGTTE